MTSTTLPDLLRLGRCNALDPADRNDQNRSILERLSRGIPVREDPSLAPFVRPARSAEPIQRWLQYREGYTLELCRQVFDDRESLVVDPFCGFGSTLVAATQQGLPSIGFDMNPLAVFVSEVKTRAYSSATRRAIQRQIGKLKSLSPSVKVASPPELRILPKLFHPEILHALMAFRAAIDAVRNSEVRSFLLLAWIAILEGVSNTYREGNGIKYRNRLRRGNTYSVIPYDEWQAEYFPPDKFAFVRDCLLDQLHIMLVDIEGAVDKPAVSVFHADARDGLSEVANREASLALFSPPYCNCFNYIKAYKLELWLGGFIRSYAEIRPLTRMSIRSRMESLPQLVAEPYPEAVDDLIGLMNHSTFWNSKLPDVLRGYFADMRLVLELLSRKIKRNGRCVIIVGNSAYSSVLIPTDLLLTHIAIAAGFEVEEIVVARHLTTSSQQKKNLEPVKDYLRESVIHLRRIH